MSAWLECEHIKCHHDHKLIVDDVSFHIQKGDIACLLGPSGCGKTTTLRAIAGLKSISEGEIRLRQKQVAGRNSHVDTQHRQIGMVFQDYALFPHLTVSDNILFGIKRWSAERQQQTLNELLELTDLEGLDHQFPHELSGGQQQRVALARALAPEPDLILLDEPFSNLDVTLRYQLRQSVKRILNEKNTTALLVTHDQDEAFAMADHVGVMFRGKLHQWDTPFNLYHEPINPEVAYFIGEGQFINGIVRAPDCVETAAGVIHGNRAYNFTVGSKVQCLIRPDDIVPDPNSDKIAHVVRKAFRGAVTLYTLQLKDGCLIKSLFSSHHDYQIGEVVRFNVEADHLIIFANS